MASIWFEWKGLAISTIAASLAVAGLISAQNAGMLPPPVYQVSAIHWFALSVMAGVTGGLTYLSHQTTQRALIRAEQEIAKRERVELELRKLSRAVEQSPASIVITDLHGVIEYVNSRFTQTTGYSFEEAIGANPRILKTARTPRATYSQLWTTLTAGKEWHGEFVNRKKDGSLYYELAIITPISDLNGVPTHYLAVKEDITERKQAEEALRQAVEDLAQARDAAEVATRAKSAFLANMSHEIRTPLNAVIGMAALLHETELTDDQRQLADTIHTGGQALLSVINDILDFSRIESGRVDLEALPFDLYACLASAIDLVAHGARQKGLKVTWACDPQVPRAVVGDEGRLRQVLLNLLGNAVKFTHQGEVCLQATAALADGAATLVTINVRDTGIGITPEQRDRIFAPFLQAERSTARYYGGTGLGLAICQQLVSLMGGTIDVTSTPDVGSIFTVVVPFRKAALDDLPSAAAPEVGVIRPLRVLVAEDNLINQEVARRMLIRLGHTATVVGDGQAAVDAVAREPYDVVLMDMQMPLLDGEAATQRIRQSEKLAAQPYIIALTANALDADRKRVLQVGMDDYLSKPVQPGELQQALSRVLCDDAPMPGAAAPEPVASDCATLIQWAKMEDLLEAFGADGSQALDIVVELFDRAIPTQIDLIMAASVAQDLEQIRREAHRMRGGYLQIGAQSMAALCGQLEHIDSLRAAESLLAQLRTCYAQTYALFRQRYLSS